MDAHCLSSPSCRCEEVEALTGSAGIRALEPARPKAGSSVLVQTLSHPSQKPSSNQPEHREHWKATEVLTGQPGELKIPGHLQESGIRASRTHTRVLTSFLSLFQFVSFISDFCLALGPQGVLCTLGRVAASSPGIIPRPLSDQREESSGRKIPEKY